MAATINEIPEIRGLDARRDLIRIPPETDVPLTPRVRQLVDTPAFRRLARISQLGLVSLVYPAAHHSRFEHCLGVYRTALLYLRQLSQNEHFTRIVSVNDAECFLVAALLHDIGHWPFCHPIEDMCLDEVPSHEGFAAEFVHQGAVASVLQDAWQIEPEEVTSLLRGDRRSDSTMILGSLLSGPIDVDKMDYLGRDSLHAGVPYGRNFDRARLIGSLCLNAAGDALAITDKGRSAAEMMVFARYVMFSEVYWHHAVRSATAMLQRAFYLLRGDLDLDTLFRADERSMVDTLLAASRGSTVEPLIEGLFGPRRQLYKRLEQYSLFQQPELYERLARRPFAWLARCAANLADGLGRAMGQSLAAEHVLLDAPPVKREIEIQIDVYFPKEARHRPLAEVSPVVQTLAKKQFDDYVKRVRVYVAPGDVHAARKVKDLSSLLHDAIDVTESTWED